MGIRVLALIGFVFLYAPIIGLMIYSFNASKLVTVWGGFSTKWYAALLDDSQILTAAWVSLKIAFISASIATVLGTLAAIIMLRFGRFAFRNLFSGMMTAPLVMPEVITGLSLLLLFVSLQNLFGFSGRGVTTIVIAHSTFCLAFVAVIVQSRLASMDRMLEEAAADLGARPLQVWLDVTLPVISPALLSAWLLAFTLSLDDLVIASFVAGPGASTLPMVIFSKARLGVDPSINALATLMIAFVGIGVVCATWALLRADRKRGRGD